MLVNLALLTMEQALAQLETSTGRTEGEIDCEEKSSKKYTGGRECRSCIAETRTNREGEGRSREGQERALATTFWEPGR